MVYHFSLFNAKKKKVKQKAMETRLIVRPLVGCLTHTHFWEGPCLCMDGLTPADISYILKDSYGIIVRKPGGTLTNTV